MDAGEEKPARAPQAPASAPPPFPARYRPAASPAPPAPPASAPAPAAPAPPASTPTPAAPAPPASTPTPAAPAPPASTPTPAAPAPPGKAPRTPSRAASAASNRGSAEASPRHQGHRRSRRPSADTTNLSEEEDPLKIIVTGYPQYSQTQDLTRVFAKFGSVKLEAMNNKYATLVYLTEDDAKAAVQASKKVNVYGEFLSVRPASAARLAELAARHAQPGRDCSRANHKETKGSLIDPKEIDLSGDFHQQLERVLASVRLTQEDVASLTTLYTDLEVALQQQWPGCSAVPFGSITTGLGVKSSDADCFVHVPPQFRHPHGNFVHKAKRVLQQYPEVFAELVAIPRANTPIVKLFHVPTRTRADVTFKTPLGAQNSKLVAFLLHSDPRLLPMAVAVKYWARVHEFSGTGKLTNYALTLLIVFYLQQPPMSILPSVQWLQRDPATEFVVDFWNTGFDGDKASLPPCGNTSTVSELIGGFFEYYSMFNFDEMVVCPYLGAPIKKELFHNPTLLPEEFNRYKSNVGGNIALPLRCHTPVCVQDPLEQCHNVASAINGKLAAEIKAYFKFAANAYEKEKLSGCEHFLSTILLQKPKIIRSKSHPEYRVNLFPRIIVTIIDPDWKPVVRDVIFNIFERMLKIKLGKVEEKVNLDTKKQKEKYMGHVTKAIWRRKQFSRLYSAYDIGFLEKQARITDEIINVDKEVLAVQFQLTLTFCQEPRSAVVAIKLGAGDLAAFRDFGKFFISVMQGWFLNLLRPFARPPELDTAAKIAETIRLLDADPDSDDDLRHDIVVTNSNIRMGCGGSEGPGPVGAGAGAEGSAGGAGSAGGEAAEVY